MAQSAHFVINGRFLGAPATGVQRVARNLVTALDDQIAGGEADGMSAEVLTPPGVDGGLALKAVSKRSVGRLKGQAWEQLDLPFNAKSKNLVNLCNAAPFVSESAATMIHDAQIFLSPQSYSAQFRAWYRLSLPTIARRARRVLTVSTFSKSMLDHYGVSPAAHTEVVYNGVDHVLAAPSDAQILSALDLSSRGYVVVFGSLQAHKNLSVILKAFQSPALADLRLVIVGAVTEAALTERFGALPSQTVMAGPVRDGQLRALLEGATALLFPSTTEGFGLPPLEAMTLGCPTVVAPNGALPEVCGDATLYADAEDPEAWIDAITRLARGAALWQDLSARGLKQAQRFTWASSARTLSRILNEVAL